MSKGSFEQSLHSSVQGPRREDSEKRRVRCRVRNDIEAVIDAFAPDPVVNAERLLDLRPVELPECLQV
jgi:hypothetical protein